MSASLSRTSNAKSRISVPIPTLLFPSKVLAESYNLTPSNYKFSLSRWSCRFACAVLLICISFTYVCFLSPPKDKSTITVRTWRSLRLRTSASSSWPRRYRSTAAEEQNGGTTARSQTWGRSVHRQTSYTNTVRYPKWKFERHHRDLEGKHCNALGIKFVGLTVGLQCVMFLGAVSVWYIFLLFISRLQDFFFFLNSTWLAGEDSEPDRTSFMWHARLFF